MNLRHLILHLRLPFSLYLMPVFLFALSQQVDIHWPNTLIVFVVLHLFLYPSSNGYNSYMDQDTGSIGGIKSPPKVPKAMFFTSIILDILGLLLLVILLQNNLVSLLALLYILASRAYSYRKIRIKRFPIMGFLHVSFFQGVVIFLLSSSAMSNNMIVNTTLIVQLIIAFLLVAAGYPLTQIYQHDQDKADNVTTLSMKLGIKGTFIFSGILFFLLGICLFLYLGIMMNEWLILGLFAVFTFPVFSHFFKWMKQVYENQQAATFENTMRMNNLGALCVNLYFIVYITLHNFL
jgi:1,4-dihydroxy-2-naphthoate octaprenyltransferase